MKESQPAQMNVYDIRNKLPQERTPAEQKFLEDMSDEALSEKYGNKKDTIDGQVKKAIPRKH